MGAGSHGWGEMKTVTTRMRLILFNGCIEAEGSLPAVETGFFR